MRLIPHLNRKRLQIVALLFCLSPLLRIIYLDTENVQLVFFGVRFARENIYLPVLAACVVLGVIVFYTVKFGRFFCAFLCPVHLYLEHRSQRRWDAWRKALPWIVPPLATEALISFVFPYGQQWEMYTSSSFPQPILIAHGIILSVMLCVFFVYEERFCLNACPYAVFQNLCRRENTVVTVFNEEAGRCVDCKACEQVCPMKLDVRRQSMEPLCSNCSLCIDACATILGEGKEVMTQIREQDLPDDLPSPQTQDDSNHAR